MWHFYLLIAICGSNYCARLTAICAIIARWRKQFSWRVIHCGSGRAWCRGRLFDRLDRRWVTASSPAVCGKIIFIYGVFCGGGGHSMGWRGFLKGCVLNGRIKFRQFGQQVIHFFRRGLNAWSPGWTWRRTSREGSWAEISLIWRWIIWWLLIFAVVGLSTTGWHARGRRSFSWRWRTSAAIIIVWCTTAKKRDSNEIR